MGLMSVIVNQTLIIKSAFRNRRCLAKFSGISFRPFVYRLSCEETGIKPCKMNADFGKLRVWLVEAKSFYRQLVKIYLSKLFSDSTKNAISVKNCYRF